MSGAAPIAAAGVALLAMDLQRDFLADDARLPIARDQIDGVIDKVNAAITAARERGWAVVYVQNAFARWNPANLFRNHAAVVGSGGAELDPRILLIEPAARIGKQKRDAFRGTNLDEILRAQGVSRLLICGVFAEACVLATARAAKARGYPVTLLSDAVGGASDAARERALCAASRRGLTLAPVDRAFEAESIGELRKGGRHDERRLENLASHDQERGP